MTQKLVELTDSNAGRGVYKWQPKEDYADLILEASLCEASLSGVITAMDYDKSAGTGINVQVRMFPSRSAQGPIAVGKCLSVASSILSTATITIQQYGDYDDLYGMDLFTAKGPVKDGILNEMARGLGKARDVAIMSALNTVNHITCLGNNRYKSRITTSVACTSVTTTGTTGCCEMKYVTSIYNSIVSGAANLKARGLHPDVVIINPGVARWFKYRGYTSMPNLGWTMDAQNNLATIDGMRIIETCAANPCVVTSGATMAYVLDSSRAIAEAWGKRPEFYEDFVVECNKYKETVWMYWGCSVVSCGAIAAIVNP